MGKSMDESMAKNQEAMKKNQQIMVQTLGIFIEFLQSPFSFYTETQLSQSNCCRKMTLLFSFNIIILALRGSQ